MKTIRYYPFEHGRTLYPVDFQFGFIQRNHVYVYVGDDPTVQVAYTWVNNGQISLANTIQPNNTLKIRRIVPRSNLLNDYENGARLSANNLNKSYKQALMVLEEVADGFITENETFNLQNTLKLFKDLDANGQRIKNLPIPLEGHEAVPFSYYKDIVADATFEVERAKLEADRSKLEADRSKTEADRAANVINVGVIEATSQANRSKLEADRSEQEAQSAKDAALILSEILNDAVAAGMNFPLDLGFITTSPVSLSYDLGGI